MAKAPPKEAKAEAETEGEEQSPKKKGKLPLIIGLVVLLAAGGGGTWFFMFRDKGEPAAEQQAKPQPLKPPVFVPLDAFTVNLSSAQGDQFLQVAATLKVLDQAAADSAKQYMPEIRHKTLVMLSTKKAMEITSGEGRERLAEEIRQTANNVLLAAAGRPTKPIVLDVPRPAEDAPEAEPKPDTAGAASTSGESAPPTEAGASPQAAAPAAADAPAVNPATMLSKAAADDPVQSVFFTSFIIQ
ncbi:MAG: flagellar basal body-associated FliL family protein [Betaproteobacteria bacterium]|nr:flagellar basal body-associated FliL family protein [Betaproteobacteria bacterium]